jgi:transposase
VSNANLPNDLIQLQRLVVEGRAALEEAHHQIKAAHTEIHSRDVQIQNRDLLIEHLKLQIAKLKRQRFGRSSEQLDSQIAQLELTLEELESGAAEPPQPSVPSSAVRVRQQPVRKPLPEHLPREDQVHAPACNCPSCGGALDVLGADISEVLEYIPSRFKVIRHVRPKLRCGHCELIVQQPAPSRPIARGLAGPGLLAHVIVAKYADHLPLYRQSAIFAREGIDLDRSTLADWVGGVSALLDPLIEAIGRHVLAAEKLHADDTPVPVLSPGRGSTKTGRLWTYVRDDRPAGSDEPAAVLFRYSPDRKGERPCAHLASFRGLLQADGYSGFNGLYDRRQDPLTEVACWAHVRRKFYDLTLSKTSPLAQEALTRIGALYAVEAEIRGRPATERAAVRQSRAGPYLDAFHAWLNVTLTQISKKSELANAIRYALSRWTALTRYRDDGRLEIDNNAAERALRTVALGRKNYLFAGSDAGGERAASLYTLLGTAKLNDLNPEAYLRDVLERIADHPINRIDELLPWHVAPHLTEPQLNVAA